jgi:hypothetical protein
MKAKGVRHAFSMHALLQWQVMFYSDEQIVSRWTSEVERYPAYVREMDGPSPTENQSLWLATSATRMGSRTWSTGEAIFTVDNRYFVYVGADKALLKKLRFQFVD